MYQKYSNFIQLDMLNISGGDRNQSRPTTASLPFTTLQAASCSKLCKITQFFAFSSFSSPHALTIQLVVFFFFLDKPIQLVVGVTCCKFNLLLRYTHVQLLAVAVSFLFSNCCYGFPLIIKNFNLVAFEGFISCV